jgi:hypothetical protein
LIVICKTGDQFANLPFPFLKLSSETITSVAQPKWAMAFAETKNRPTFVVGQEDLSVIDDKATATIRRPDRKAIKRPQGATFRRANIQPRMVRFDQIIERSPHGTLKTR